VREYLRFRAKLRGLDRMARDAAIARVTERCWLGDVIDRPIGQLSKGFRQRVGLGDALLHNPPVLILDEPTIGLDPAQIRETRSLMRALAQEHTLLFSSHILPEVEATSQRIILINQGRIVASGTADELKARVTDEWWLFAEVKAPAADASGGVGRLPGVVDVKAHTQDGWTRLRIRAREDVRQAVHQLFSEKGWAVRELRRELPTLEDFFVKAVLETRDERAGD
jgi:ABC-2 type transport system ATP-binding protein